MIQLFPAQDSPRVFGVPIGLDFPAETVAGLLERLGSQPPHALGQVEILVNTGRMQRRLQEVLSDRGRAGFLPKIRLITDLGAEAGTDRAPATLSPLRRMLDLRRLVLGLLETTPDLAPRSAALDLTISLVSLLEECEGEGVSLQQLAALDVEDLSAHWQRALAFISIIGPFLKDSSGAVGPEGRQRAAVLRKIAQWQDTPPRHPILIAGSTGSRGTTALLMTAVARLPQGALLLPGFDTDQPPKVWAEMSDALIGEDHPQFRFARLLQALDLDPASLPLWTDTASPAPGRNRLVSLALRPAPVTDQWRAEGPDLRDLPEALANTTLIEAASQREEALSIAVALRDSAAAGKRAALITPDRGLTRQVTAALDRWRIEPDDSAGRPLVLSAPGRFLSHVAAMMGAELSASALLILLKHPLTHSERPDRGDHLRHSRDLELHLRKAPFVELSEARLRAWAASSPSRTDSPADPARAAWMDWVLATVGPLTTLEDAPLDTLATVHRNASERLAAGPGAEGAGGLWDKTAGEKAKAVLDALALEAAHGGSFASGDFAALLARMLAQEEVRDPVRPDPRIMIWGTLEARVQGADVVILAGLNDGIWPKRPDPDPWMNRKMRHEAGLLVPERQVGLSAHDFQQAMGAREVILTRATRDSEAETVPSRWLNRITNLLDGLSDESRAALAGMRTRGAAIVTRARGLDRPAAVMPLAKRPSPIPAPGQFPPRISASRVETLIRDPFEIYCGTVLGLRPLDPLDRPADAALRGTVLHKVLETALSQVMAGTEMTATLLRQIAARVLDEHVPWPEVRTQWRARFESYATQLAEAEVARLRRATPAALERRGELTLASGVRLTCEADRIDIAPDGTAIIYDYKTGTVPGEKEVEAFTKQLHLEAVIAEAGRFEDLPPLTVSEIAYLQINKDLKIRALTFEPGDVGRARDEFAKIMDDFLSGERGFTARRMPRDMKYVSDYDHLSRFGEWDQSDTPVSEEMP
ncbi:double-strand break repair protein AddB [Dinoroseobacter sp. PD6]|uniref:double-strand break repair protein AddB n=1 Tax=Dinoroseobacter sp. PD6 TaxID=3028384 RepID=UPI00237A4F6E|nr:double-strand break repair protein AddB [Dinoroseobacter sp. PD6]MDD9718111.1 double-strand break repair protein AddB [Dinoroseobacter sp. PD6]